jgi:hypothetical protein
MPRAGIPARRDLPGAGDVRPIPGDREQGPRVLLERCQRGVGPGQVQDHGVVRAYILGGHDHGQLAVAARADEVTEPLAVDERAPGLGIDRAVVGVDEQRSSAGNLARRRHPVCNLPYARGNGGQMEERGAPASQEVTSAEFGIVADTGGKTIGQYQTVASPLVDRWKWSSTAFPAAGFSITFQNSGNISEPTATYPSYTFLTSTAVPSQQWGGSKVYTINKNGTLVGWFEADNSSPAKLMWWSNGVALSGNKISVRSGDVLTFTPGALPTTAQRPLQFPQTPI